MAPKKVTNSKAAPKTPTKSPAQTSPSKANPTKSMSALTTDVNAQVLWHSLFGLVNAGHSIDYGAVASKLGMTKIAVRHRVARLKAAFEQTDSASEAQTEDVVNEAGEEGEEMIKAEPSAKEDTSVSLGQEASAVDAEAMEEA